MLRLTKVFLSSVLILLGYSLKAQPEIRPSTYYLTSGALEYKSILKSYLGFGGGYGLGLTPKIDFNISVQGYKVYYPHKSGMHESAKKQLLEGDLNASFHLFKYGQKKINPFINIGAGVFNVDGITGGYAPLGVGFDAPIYNGISMIANAQYRVGLNKEAVNHYNFNIGVGFTPGLFRTGNKVQQPSNVYRPLDLGPDKDGDGTPDAYDDCPELAGPAFNKGCPLSDTDGDGIVDSLDKCPTIPGLVKYSGCLSPDADGDGIPDELDLCPAVKGKKESYGCPGTANDLDGDGILNKVDRCPIQAGISSNFGCPANIQAPESVPELPNYNAYLKALVEINKPVVEFVQQPETPVTKPPVTEKDPSGLKRVESQAERNLFFMVNSAQLSTANFNILEFSLANFKSNTNWTIQITGYLDKNEATVTANKDLSINRALAIKKYYTDNGIAESRIKVIDGKIDTTNKFLGDDYAGNRRAEIIIFQ
ncbi:OmpA family protein [Polluticaenibacter yanchengensis]|uniref:Thrombospondin type 3 repeat-containing protein n=1 Tax=Polluticaenibacter yanchengensis TaxID=3014562 RepID=A0ABT4UG07_9BACT|nr:thrombospondin type 3 repeat-containing protein [Chitinophagaceae bacterium LY-5]